MPSLNISARRSAQPSGGAVILSSLAVLMVITICGCGGVREEVDASALYGRWEVAEVRGLSLPAECSKAYYQITATTIEGRSGQLVVRAAYRVRREGNGFTLEQYEVSNNGLPNCQGISADYVMSHWIEELDVDVVDGRLRLYFPDRTHDRYTDFVRVRSAEEGDPKGQAADAMANTSLERTRER